MVMVTWGEDGIALDPGVTESAVSWEVTPYESVFLHQPISVKGDLAFLCCVFGFLFFSPVRSSMAATSLVWPVRINVLYVWTTHWILKIKREEDIKIYFNNLYISIFK